MPAMSSQNRGAIASTGLATRTTAFVARRKRIKRSTGRSLLIRELDRLYSLYVRQLYADSDGMVQCYTCPGVYPWRKMHNGHYIPRGYKHTRWDLMNVRPQCFLCNIRHYGNSHRFRKKLVVEYGEDAIIAMEERSEREFIEKDEWIEAKIETAYAMLEKAGFTLDLGIKCR